MTTARQCARIYLDTDRRCENRIEWWRRIDAVYCTDRCRFAARDQRRKTRGTK